VTILRIFYEPGHTLAEAAVDVAEEESPGYSDILSNGTYGLSMGNSQWDPNGRRK
jgi:hypothetical protein